ncbi:zincin [Parathielavia hyrcaniae]|uniref:Zincin n=1 Tax=Parathielavia hyrcaniae TaxID=113614 RepID=A0AAN6Q3W8_9PEZI|nr:zincin [Parathielavia hyrcaniae]
MRLQVLSVLSLLQAGVWAAPTTTASAASSTETTWDFRAGAVTEYPIHSSCNVTLRRQLERALDETVELAEHARDHILRWGNESPFFIKYFGTNTSTAMPIGWFSRIAAADRRDMAFRCDDADKNCATQEGWAGHWRGANATQETVICDLSFTRRRWLNSVCGLGYTVSESPLNTFWATDLLHRVLHVPRISENIVDHFSEDYEGVLELARTEPEKSVIDSDTLQYFAIDVYAFDIAAPGVGCSGHSE